MCCARLDVRAGRILALGLVALAIGVGRAVADTVTLQSGVVLRGSVDRDGSIVSIFDGLKRTVMRDTKILRIEPDPPGGDRAGLERFSVVQPLEIHAGSMPEYAMGIRAEPWDALGRRGFRYLDARSKRPIGMTQAINEVGPDYVRLRGVDGFWQGQLSTEQVPRDVILNILGKVDKGNQNERLRVGRLLIQARWYPEARAELDRLERDFPDLATTIDGVRQVVVDLEARQMLIEAEARLAAQQPRGAIERLKALATGPVPGAVADEARSRLGELERRGEADRSLSKALQEALEGLTEADRPRWSARVTAIRQAMAEAPDVGRARLVPAVQAIDAGRPPVEILATAVSGWVAGADSASADPKMAEALATAAEGVQAYLAAPDEATRTARLAALQSLTIGGEGETTRPLDPETVTKLVEQLPPSHREANPPAPGEPRLCRVRDDPNPTPSEYMILLPPEYHPLRSYPAVVALHSGAGPAAAVAWWGPEAARRGYVVIAPEYVAPGAVPDYRYTADEHAAVSLALRDARKRFAIDSDRVFLGGQLLGGNMAWDYGLAHPDLFAGAVIVGGLPAKYVGSYKKHAEHLPLYVALGDLAPGAVDIVFPMAKSLMTGTHDVTYVEYYRRGLEDFPEEDGPAFDWMASRRRDPYPKEFEVVTARVGDDRFYGLVVREHAPGRSIEPGLVDPLGRNLRPATLGLKSNALGNLVSVKGAGVNRMDVWLSPKLVDFGRKVEVRVNGRRVYGAVPPVDFAPLLEDLRVRGDRKQLYWLKVPVG